MADTDATKPTNNDPPPQATQVPPNPETLTPEPSKTIAGAPGQTYQLPGLIYPYHDLPPGSPSKPPIPTTEQPKQLPASQLIRGHYADALNEGTTLGPDDFHESYHNTSMPPHPGLASQLPSSFDFIESALQALKDGPKPDPGRIETTKQNLIDHWVATGERPDQAIQNPDQAQQMTRDLKRIVIGGVGTQAITDAANNHGVDPNLALATAKIESDMGRAPDQPGSQYRGIFQLGREERVKAGGSREDIGTIEQQVEQGVRTIADTKERLTKELGREPNNAEVYLAHQQGVAGAHKLLANPDTPAGQVVPPQNIKANGGDPDKPAWVFTKMWAQKYAHAEAGGDSTLYVAKAQKYDPTFGVTPTFSEEIVQAAKDFGAEFIKGWQTASKEESAKAREEWHQMMSGEFEPEKSTAFQTATGFGPGIIGAVSKFTGSVVEQMFHTPESWAKLQNTRMVNDYAQEVAETSIRAATGLARRAMAAATDALEGLRHAVSRGVPAFERWVASGRPLTSMWDQYTPDLMHMLDDIENMSAGGGRLDPNSPLQPLIHHLRALYQDTQRAIEREFPTMNGFIKDYYRHLWTDPRKAQQLFDPKPIGRTGSAASMQKRSVPTIAEGIARGLKPVYADPIENILHYISSMRAYLASQQVLRVGEEMGFVKYHNMYSPPIEHPDWVKITGRGSLRAEVTTPYPSFNAEIRQAYAPKGFANAYNSYVGRGIYDWQRIANNPGAQKLLEKVQYAINMTTALKLSASGYHYWNIAAQSMWSGVSNALGEIGRGEVTRGLRDMGLALAAPVRMARRGADLGKVYLRQGGSAADEQLMQLLAQAGGRAVGRGMEYGYQQSANWVTAFKRGSAAYQIKNRLKATLGPEDEPIAKTAALLPFRAVGIIADTANSALHTLTAPLFDKWVPHVKTAAFADEMAAWLRANGTATERATVAQARKIVDSIDDRFGEMVQDNIFWHRTTKQILNALTVSVGWEYGSLRAMWNGSKDVLTGQWMTPQARWLLTWPIMQGLQSSFYQYLKTGTTPFSTDTTTRDLIAPRTGGQTPEGAPERAIYPGYTSEPVGIYNVIANAPDLSSRLHNGINWVVGRGNPAVQLSLGTATMKDWQGNPIITGLRDPKTFEIPTPWEEYGKFVLESLQPITMGTQNQRLRGTNVTGLERLGGIRPAAGWLEDPERSERGMEHGYKNELRRIDRSRRRQQGRVEQ